VLVVEDDQDIRESIREVLEDEGFSVVTAPHGGIALEVIRREGRRPSIILLDLMMPVMNGWEFSTELRKSGPRIPIVVLSGDAHAQDQASAIGAVEVLTKPISLAKLLEVIARWTTSS
jgi:CheY-like chemotaxis protein